MQKTQLYYKQRSEIDSEKWNQCIDKASNGLIYAYSFYLDFMADQWNAIILNDYEAVLPLPWRKKFGFYYLYQPAFIAQLGIFGNNLTPDIVESFLKEVPSKYKLWEFPLNQGNFFQLKSFNLQERINYVLPLNKTYKELYINYRENIKRNIKKSNQYGCYAKPAVEVDSIIELAKQQPNTPPEDELRKFKRAFEFLKKSNAAKSYGIFSNKDELLASCAFVFSHNRAYYILVGNHPNGRTLGASHALIDAFIKDHAGENLLLDFEGSDIRNLAFFYSSFGAGEEKYPAIKLNKLPWYIKWMKD